MAGRYQVPAGRILRPESEEVILAHGASVHGLQGLSRFPGNKWVDVVLMRINHSGARMDGDVNQVAEQPRRSTRRERACWA